MAVLKDVVSSSQLMDAKTRLNQAAVYTSKQQGVALELPVFRYRDVASGCGGHIYIW